MALELPDGWKEQLPDEIKTSGVLDDIKTIDQMATMVVNGRKLQSNQISIPGEDVSPEKRDEFLKDKKKAQEVLIDLVGERFGTELDFIDLKNLLEAIDRGDATDIDVPAFKGVGGMSSVQFARVILYIA